MTPPAETNPAGTSSSESRPSSFWRALPTPPGSLWRPAPLVSALEDDQVFVFGANASGFHGAGAAAVALLGHPGGPRHSPRHWSKDATFTRCHAAPPGSPDRVGRWAVYGVPQGPMQGREGRSYAVQTVVRAGARRSMPLDLGGHGNPARPYERLPCIGSQVRRLKAFAQARPHLTFLVPAPSLCGYTPDELGALYVQAPANVILIRSA